MKVFVMCLVGLVLATGALSAADNKEIAGRWMGSVTADAGEMPFAMELAEKNGTLAGTLETMHGNWTVTSATEKDGTWTIAVTTDDGAKGRLVGRVKDGKLTGDWDFKPRAVGTFELSRAKKK